MIKSNNKVSRPGLFNPFVLEIEHASRKFYLNIKRKLGKGLHVARRLIISVFKAVRLLIIICELELRLLSENCRR